MHHAHLITQMYNQIKNDQANSIVTPSVPFFPSRGFLLVEIGLRPSRWSRWSLEVNASKSANHYYIFIYLCGSGSPGFHDNFWENSHSNSWKATWLLHSNNWKAISLIPFSIPGRKEETIHDYRFFIVFLGEGSTQHNWISVCLIDSG